MSSFTSASAEQHPHVPTAPLAMARRQSSVFRGMMGRAELGADLGISDRTIIRMERRGMPFIAVGNIRRYEPEKVRAWFLSHENSHKPPRRGRPRKATG